MKKIILPIFIIVAAIMLVSCDKGTPLTTEEIKTELSSIITGDYSDPIEGNLTATYIEESEHSKVNNTVKSYCYYSDDKQYGKDEYTNSHDGNKTSGTIKQYSINDGFVYADITGNLLDYVGIKAGKHKIDELTAYYLLTDDTSAANFLDFEFEEILTSEESINYFTNAKDVKAVKKGGKIEISATFNKKNFDDNKVLLKSLADSAGIGFEYEGIDMDSVDKLELTIKVVIKDNVLQ